MSLSPCPRPRNAPPHRMATSYIAPTQRQAQPITPGANARRGSREGLAGESGGRRVKARHRGSHHEQMKIVWTMGSNESVPAFNNVHGRTDLPWRSRARRRETVRPGERRGRAGEERGGVASVARATSRAIETSVGLGRWLQSPQESRVWSER
jgi:hypothetical protein